MSRDASGTCRAASASTWPTATPGRSNGAGAGADRGPTGLATAALHPSGDEAAVAALDEAGADPDAVLPGGLGGNGDDKVQLGPLERPSHPCRERRLAVREPAV